MKAGAHTEPLHGKEILIAGGGIGGLTAALIMAQHGAQVRVFEQAATFSEAGAGIQLSPNCSRVLHALGLAEALDAHGFLPRGTQFRHWRRGGLITENMLGQDSAAKYGAPYYHIHRGDLLSILLQAAQADERIQLVTQAQVRGFTVAGQRVTVELNDVPATLSAAELCGDLLLGADGIHSKIRELLWGPSEPDFTGNIAWRALVPATQLPSELIKPVTTVWWGPHKHFVHYYVRGGDLVNCVCVVEKTGWTVESWTQPGELAELQADFRGWHDDVQQLMAQADPNSLFKWALFDRQPMPRWGQNRVTLLGDACHPTLPFMAQGAAMAIEDGAILAACLAARSGDADVDWQTALERYETLRKPRTAGVQRGSRRNAKVFHLRGVQAWLRNRAARVAQGATVDKLYSYDPLSIVEKSDAEASVTRP